MEPISYHLEPTGLVPNSPYPLLYYRNAFEVGDDGKVDPQAVMSRYSAHGWEAQWVVRYGPTQPAHFHPEAYEVMVVLAGPGRIRFGAGEGEWERGVGIVLDVQAGDAFVIPAGVAHKSFDPAEDSRFEVLSGSTTHGIEAAVRRSDLSGFVMCGAYPRGCAWSWEESWPEERFERVWGVERPELEPIRGGRLSSLWQSGDTRS